MEKRVMYSFKIDYKDLLAINLWATRQNFPMSWGVRFAIKEFIKSHVEPNLAIPAENVNRGAAVRLPRDEQGKIIRREE